MLIQSMRDCRTDALKGVLRVGHKDSSNLYSNICITFRTPTARDAQAPFRISSVVACLHVFLHMLSVMRMQFR